MRRLFHFYINSSIHVSFAVLALAYVTAIKFGIELDIRFIAFLFFGTITAYNFVKYAEVAGLNHRSLARSLKEIQFFSILSLVGLIISVFWINLEVILVCIFLGLLTLFYAIPLFFKDKNLRSISGIKIFIIAFVWAGVTVILPILQNELNITQEIWWIVLQRFFYVLAVMIPFEIRDLKYDHSALKTLPQQFGVLRTKLVGYTIVIFFFAISLMLYFNLPKHLLIDGIVALIVSFAIGYTTVNKSRFYSSFWVESIPILWVLLLIFGL
ncbi:hypothetical protein [Dokdonia sp. Hel_I_53]|uniref:hypothetical protein n=1 Tax=Dokdonia sp. Hel_I_53 TaxID=1566287 RepID=UPI00119A94CE|nr:hypothetical protein [Dokdonia sp. Hel_I_53]TVZ53153.1 hypothetical protein OD90_2350 [Dokdonia sp. Hel_I_53]